MPKVADVQWTWKKSVGTNVSKVSLRLVLNGIEQVITLTSPDIEQYSITVGANSSGTFRVDTYGQGDLVTSSVELTWSVGNLEAPPPATDLAFKVLAVRDDGTGDGGGTGPSAAMKKAGS